MANTANIMLNVYDGRRQLLDNAIQWSATAIDGRGLNERRTLVFPPFHGGAQVLNVPFFDNFGDNYTILVKATGFEGNAWRPVTVSDRVPVTLDMMLLPENGKPHFAGATWDKLNVLRPNVARMIRASGATSDAAGAMYTVPGRKSSLSSTSRTVSVV